MKKLTLTAFVFFCELMLAPILSLMLFDGLLLSDILKALGLA